jgi:hypothetical protein
MLYLWYGVVCAGMGEREFGCEVGLQAAVICDRFHSLQYKGKCLSMMGSSIMPWCRPFAQTFQVLDQSWRLAISVGDIQWAGYTSVWVIHNPLCKGTDIPIMHIEWFLIDQTNRCAINDDVTSYSKVCRLVSTSKQ